MKNKILFIASALLISACTSHQTKENKAEEKNAATNYSLTTVEKGGVADVVKLPAQLTAYEEVSIFPKVNAYVKKVLVDIGSNVSEGTVLMILEAPELEQAVLQAKEKYLRSKADLILAKENCNRLIAASNTAGAISPMDISIAKAKVEADSALCNAEKANWQMQQTMLGYLNVTAPFAGVITERNVHPGALVNATAKDKPMLELKQINRLRLQVDVPDAIASSLHQNDTVSFFVNAFAGKKMLGFINRKANNINAQYRSERIEIDVNNPNEILAAGMFAEVVLHNKGDINALSVPKTAVVISTERKYVLLMKEGKLIKTDVSTGNETASKIEVYGALQAGDKIVAVANDEMGK